MRRFDKTKQIKKTNILLEERMRNLKEYGSEFGPEGEFDNSELQGQEDFYDNMNQNSKVKENIDFNNIENAIFKIFSKYIKDPNDIENALERYNTYGYKGLPKELIANLDRDMDWITIGQIQHDDDTNKLEGVYESLKESFNKTFNKIRRASDTILNESEYKQKDWKDEVILDDGETYTVYLTRFKLFTSDSGFRYSVSVPTQNLTDNDKAKLFNIVRKVDDENTLELYKTKFDGNQTTLLITSSENRPT